MLTDGRVRILSPDVARKIAAGEVIDRPAAVVREAVDNALDSGARSIEVSIEGGGLVLIEVSDDGSGMAREDLELCTLPHATSKIQAEDDLLALETLGFRGEALASIAAVSALEIVSSTDGRGALRLAVGPARSEEGSRGLKPRIDAHHRAKGTSLRVRGLFDNLPARKKFMKRDSSEASLVYKTLVEKALSFPGVSFRLVQDGRIKLALNAVSSLRERFIDAVLEEGPSTRGMGHFVHQIASSDQGFRMDMVIAGPELSRNDRRHQYIYANGRRIQEYSFQQAIEYGSQGWFPNNSHPIAALFLEVDGPLIDFNIHPAKREARFRDSQRIHRVISGLTRSHFEALGRRTPPGQAGLPEALTARAELFDRPDAGYRPDAGSGYRPDTGSGYRPATSPPPVHEALARAALSKLVEEPVEPRSMEIAEHSENAGMENGETSFRYLGQLFGLFLAVEYGGELILIDQHAAHERILFNQISENPPAPQELLVPLPFETASREESDFLERCREDLAALGIGIQKDGKDSWLLVSLPGSWRHADGHTIEAILSLSGTGEGFAREWHASMACKKAVKDGQILDENTGRELARAALKLIDQRCPHGRPLCVRIKREELERAVKRI